ncbi:hypothetical protein [Hymenobacter sp. B81]|uniref:hypothetical protein n=1 Tax=Hymenobacter sp. B81 TaxID=3344878 RepID=UPI0037DD3DBF
MTRASLLHILDHVTTISEAEVRELEQLAATFPYCQTAHLLLAKAAHDRGSMLASQRLRRAATYAADRELLRALIEQTAPEAVAAPPVPVAAAPAPAVAPPVAPPDLSLATPAVEPSSIPVAEPAATSKEGPITPTESNTSGVALEAVIQPPAAAPEVGEPTAAPATPAPEAALAATELPAERESLAPQAPIEATVLAAPDQEPTNAVPEPAAAPETLAPAVEPAAPAAAQPALTPEPATPELTQPAAAAEAAPVPEPDLAADSEPAAEAAPAETAVADSPAARSETQLAAPADELPAVAPTIRPPVEVGSSRFEYGLAEALPPVTAYQLPEALADAETESAVVPPFRADEQLAYDQHQGSRFGYALTARSGADAPVDLPRADSWPADALLLDYLTRNRPPAPPAPSSLVLIERFLRTQPRIKAATPRPVAVAEPQADLSVRSTSAAPSLATESLAKILVMQGKTARAIEIYEQLMVRQPEKKAYFAAQIDHLKQQPE